MLKELHLLNCYNNGKNKNFPFLYIGYMEACLVNFGVIESKDNGVSDYCILVPTISIFGHNLFYRKEFRQECIIRLTENFLKENNML